MSPSPPLPASPCGYHAVADMQPSSLYQHLQRLHLQQSQYGGATGATPPSSFPCRVAAAASPLLPHSKTDVTTVSPTHHRNSPPPNNLHIIKEDSFDACEAASSRVGDVCDCRAKQLQKPHISVTDTHGHVTSMLTSHDDVLSLVKLSVSGATETPSSAPINVPSGGGKYTLPACFTWNSYSGIAPQYPAVDLANIPAESAMDVDPRSPPPSSFDLFTSQLAAMQKDRQTFATFNLDTYCCPWETCSNFARSISTGGSGQPSKQISPDVTRATSFTKLFENA